jgi:hypothetical protein
MPSTKCVTQWKIQQYIPYLHQVLCLACQESCLTPQLLLQHLSKNDKYCTSWLNAGNPGTLLTVLCSPKPSRCTFAISMHQGREISRWLKNSAFCTNFFANFHFFASFSQAHAGTLQNHIILPHANTVLNNAVESSNIFHSNLMLHINVVYEM